MSEGLLSAYCFLKQKKKKKERNRIHIYIYIYIHKDVRMCGLRNKNELRNYCSLFFSFFLALGTHFFLYICVYETIVFHIPKEA